MSAGRRARAADRRRRLGQNFLSADAAERFVEAAGFAPGECVVEVGPGSGAITLALAARGVDLIAFELDPHWADRLRARVRAQGCENVRVVRADFLDAKLPDVPFRVVGSLPFARTTAILSRLLDDPRRPLHRADLILQWEVARKRAAQPPATLRSTAWAPWWTFELGARIPARAFRPAPRVDGGVLVVERRAPALLPEAMASRYADFVRASWPFGVGDPRRGAGSRSGRRRRQNARGRDSRSP